MSFLLQLGLHNLLPALLAGSLTWLAVSAGIRLLDIRHGRLRLCLQAAPPIKSTLVLLGLAPVFAWPREIFGAWSRQAVGPEWTLPLYLLLSGLAILLGTRRAIRERRSVLADSAPAAEVSPRLQRSYERALGAFRGGADRVRRRCGCAPELGAALRVSPSPEVRTPLVVADDRPVIVFPDALIERLDDRQLDGALAHEIAHLSLRRGGVCSPAGTLDWLTLANPFVVLVRDRLRLQEELACDDLAVAATGGPDGYAEMLLEGYRFASSRGSGPLLTAATQLLGERPALSERIERLVSESSPLEDRGRQRLAFCVLWIILVVVFFSA